MSEQQTTEAVEFFASFAHGKVRDLARVLVAAIDAADADCDAANKRAEAMEKALREARTCLTDHHNLDHALESMFDESGVCLLCSAGPKTIFEVIDAALKGTP